MKISLSAKGDPRGRHCVFSCKKGKEAAEAHFIIANEILPQNVRPIREARDETVLYRLNLEKYLDKLALAFPFAELSPGVHRMLKRAEEKRLEGFEVPELDIPGYTGNLYDFQKIAVALLTDPDYAKAHGYGPIQTTGKMNLSHPGGVVDFLNDSVGLGKTHTALASIAILDAYPALVVVPNNVKYTWAEVISENYPGLSVAVYDAQMQSPAERDALIRERRDITIVNIQAIRAKAVHEGGRHTPIVGYDFANPALFDFTYEYAVLDEAHLVKTPSAQVTRGFMQLKADEWWCAMTGTPVLNRPEEIWTVLHKLYPESFPSYNEFVENICIVGNDGRAKAYRTGPMSELRAFLQNRSLRRRKEQVLDDLPQVINMPRHVVLSAEERRIYNQIEDEMALEMEDGSIKDIMGVLPQITRLKQACFSPELFGGSKHSSKITELKEIVAELVASGEKAIIFSQWEKACAIIKRELEEDGYNLAYVTGKVKNFDRQEEMRKFNEDDDCSLYVGTIGANREGINLGAATYVIFTDMGWTPAGNDQAIGRSAAGGLRGASQAAGTKVHIIELQAEDTYEQYVDQLLSQKRAIFDRMIERDGGEQRIKIKNVTLADIRRILSRRNRNA